MKNLVPSDMKNTMSSIEIAKLTGKRHDHVMRDIYNNIKRLKDSPELGSGYKPSTYKAGNGKNEVCFDLDFIASTALITGYDLIARTRVIVRWVELEKKEQDRIASQRKRDDLSVEFRPMTDAVINSRGGKETKFFHFTNECDLINRIAIGCTASKFRKFNDIEKNESIRDYLTVEQNSCLLDLQRANTVFLLEGLEFNHRKERLSALYNRQHKDKLIAETMLICS